MVPVADSAEGHQPERADEQGPAGQPEGALGQAGALSLDAANEPRERLEIVRPDDWHLHLRDGAPMRDIVAHSARVFGRALVMPNLRPPVATVEQALAYRGRILAALPPGSAFEPLMALYLTDRTSVDEVERAREAGIPGFKLYPAGATTNSDAGVSDLARVRGVLGAMERHGVALLVHGEVVDPEVDVFDREAVFIERHLEGLRRDFPALRIVLEHLTTKEGVDWVAAAPGPTAATITAHHLLYNRNALFAGGLRPHWYCLPVLKREVHRQALVAAATSASDRYFLGTDSAPHASPLKEHASGCAGCYTALAALELYAEAFQAAGALERLEAFASLRGAAFHRLAPNRGTVTLVREGWTVPERVPFGDAELKPLRGGEWMSWRVLDG